jgi:hypothetical protein
LPERYGALLHPAISAPAKTHISTLEKTVMAVTPCRQSAAQ